MFGCDRYVARLLEALTLFLAFGVLAFLARLSWPRLPYWSLALGLTGFGVMIELVQGVSGWGRTASVADVIADLVGLALGCAAYEALRNWRRP